MKKIKLIALTFLLGSFSAFAQSAPSMPGMISGTTSGLCSIGTSSATYSITAVTGATSYTWTVTSGASIIGGQGTTAATVTFTNTFTSGTLSVKAMNGSGSSAARTLALKSVPTVPGSISGTTSGLNNMSGVTYSIAAVTGATTYSWTVPSGASVMSGQGTRTVTVNFSNTFTTSATMSVTANNGCGAGPVKTLLLNSIPATPGNISGITTGLCSIGTATTTYSVTAVTGATSYTWTITSGGSIATGQGTNAVTVAFDSTFTSGTLSVKAMNGAGSSGTKTLALKSVPTVPGSISGATSGLYNMSGVPYSIAAVAGATTYSWTVPSGANITGGLGTRSVTIAFSNTFTTSATLSVTANNACGASPVKTLLLNSIPATPGNISGATIGLCSIGTSSATYSVSPVFGASSYTWIATTGANITTGQGTNAITVNFDNTFVSGILSVQASNSSGSSTARTLTLKSVLATPGTITGLAAVSINQTGVAYSIASMTGATTYSWTVPAGSSIMSGQGTRSVTVNFGSTGGNISVTANNSCGASPAKTKAIAVSAIAAPSYRTADNFSEQSTVLNVYPNPTDGSDLNLTISGLSESNSMILLSLYDLFGNKIYSQTVFCQSNDCNIPLNLNGKQFSKGIYLLNAIVNGKQYQEKIAVQ